MTDQEISKYLDEREERLKHTTVCDHDGPDSQNSLKVEKDKSIVTVTCVVCKRVIREESYGDNQANN